jgi:DNA-binding Lrp family transcriptional regulator
VWQALHEELAPLGLSVVTVALDFDPDKARPWIEAAAPTHPSLIDADHRIDELFGISNVPMAVWIDETGVLVRPAEGASIQVSALRSMEVPDHLPERMRNVLTEMKNFPDTAEAYRAAIVDWANRGADSPYALSPEEVIDRSQPRSADHSRAAACFELGHHAHLLGDHDAAIGWWKQAHALFPENWTYKRQAWTLESTPDGADSDKAQEVQEVYGTSWSEEFLAMGGGAAYVIAPRL